MQLSNNVVSLFVAAAETHASRTALLQDAQEVTYAQLLHAVESKAALYRKRGIAKGDEVLVFVPMSIQLYSTVLALLYIGAVPVFLDEWVSIQRLQACCRTVPCRALIAPAKFLLLAPFIHELRKIPIKLRPSLRSTITTHSPETQVHPQSTALITFTTGSTGTPKAANRTHTYLFAQFHALLPLLRNDARVSLITLPIVTLINLALGKTTVLPGRSFAVKKPHTASILATAMLKQKVEELVTSPAILADVISALQQRQNVSPTDMKYITTGGGAVFPQLAALTLQCFPHARCTVVYGSTEAEPISELPMQQLATVSTTHIMANGLSVGKPHPHTSVAIIPITPAPIASLSGEAFAALQLPPNAIGEIVVAGHHVLGSYINNPEALLQNKIQVDGNTWHRTGDAGCLHTNGSLYLWGRCTEQLQHDGRLYHPLIVGYAFAQLCGISAAALLMHHDQLTMIAEAQSPIEPTLLQQALTTLQLQNTHILYLPHIPRDPRHRSKIDYTQLAELLK